MKNKVKKIKPGTILSVNKFSHFQVEGQEYYLPYYVIDLFSLFKLFWENLFKPQMLSLLLIKNSMSLHLSEKSVYLLV